MRIHSVTRRDAIRRTLAAACVATVPVVLSACSEKTYKAGMFIDGTVDDGGWGQSCYDAFTAAASTHQWQSTVRENVGESEWDGAIEELIEHECNIIFAPGAQYQDAAVKAAEAHGDVMFIILNGDAEAKNIENLAPDNEQVGLLAGVLAGLISETGVIGFIGGTELAGTKLKAESYEKGARVVNDQIKAVVEYAGSFTDENRGYEIATKMVEDQNVDVLFGDASSVDAGARDALYDLGRGMAIAQPNDAGGLYDQVIAGSVVTDNEAMLRTAFRDIEEGSFGGKTVSGDLTNGGISAGTLSESLVSPYVQERYAGIVDQIGQGSFV